MVLFPDVSIPSLQIGGGKQVERSYVSSRLFPVCQRCSVLVLGDPALAGLVINV